MRNQGAPAVDNIQRGWQLSNTGARPETGQLGKSFGGGEGSANAVGIGNDGVELGKLRRHSPVLGQQGQRWRDSVGGVRKEGTDEDVRVYGGELSCHPPRKFPSGSMSRTLSHPARRDERACGH